MEKFKKSILQTYFVNDTIMYVFEYQRLRL